MSTINNDVLSRVSGDSVSAKNAIKGKSAEDMDMNDFFKLLTAQMTNQDFMDPQSNTEYVAQMAQFTTLQGMQSIQEYQLSSYAVSYTGKDVTIATVNAKGELETVKGTVERVTFYDGAPQVMVNGKSYPLHEVMEVTSDVVSSKEQSAGNSLNLVAGYIGQTVTVTDTTNPEFPKDVTGTVDSVTLKGGVPYVIVGGKEYAYTAITSVGVEKPIAGGDESLVYVKESEQIAKYVNKEVWIKQTDEDGNETDIKGIVTDYGYRDGAWHVTVDGKEYPVKDIYRSYAAPDTNVDTDDDTDTVTPSDPDTDPDPDPDPEE